MIDLRASPFFLSEESITWVQGALSSMTPEEKIGQLFCITAGGENPQILGELVQRYQPGGFMFRSAPAAQVLAAYQAMDKASKIPLLLPANLEAGGNGIATEGTYFAKEMEIAATEDPEQAHRLGEICGCEAGALGCNWSFAPIIDIDYNWRNPITNVRTFGSDPDTVLAMARAYCQGIRDSGAQMAVCIKHFPGDGRDERDQHLLATVNDLPAPQWEETYGRVYKALIDEGAETVMVGHIYQPAMTRKINPSLQEKDMLPGSTSKELVAGVLRGQLGFQGLVVTDATPMVGFSMALSRANALVAALNAGVDMLLFCKNMEEDIGSIREALQDGRLSWKRVEEAVTRILATKAHLGLPEKRKLGTLFPGNMSVLGCEKHQAWAKECAEKAVTLVKDNQNLLPISPKKTPRIRLTVLGEGKTGSFGESSSVAQPLKAALERAGFLVSLFDYATLEQGEIFTAGVGDLKGKFDLSIVAANVATGSNNTTRRLDWITLMAADEPWYTRDIPTLFVSFCNPYHMIDVPFISTFVNCYCDNQATVEACVKKLIGRDTFVGKSPIDPWCGVWGARFL